MLNWYKYCVIFRSNQNNNNKNYFSKDTTYWRRELVRPLLLYSKMAAGHFFVSFTPEAESISSYLERINLFMTASGTADEKKVAVLLSSVGLAAYTVLRDLCRPVLPETKTYGELTELLEQQYKAKPLVIAERFILVKGARKKERR